MKEENDIITITENEISTYTNDIYMISNSRVIGKTDPFKGERAFILCSLEQLIGLLSFAQKDDKMIIQHTQNLIKATDSIEEYQTFLKYMSPTLSTTQRALSLPQLTTYERKLLR